MNKQSLYPPTLDGNSIEKKRQEIREYFHNTYSLYEKIFELLKDDSVFYRKSEPTRHPMIFYFGHTATFFINKLINMKIIERRVDPNLESMFAIGVDEMSWDDVDSANYNWAEVSEVRAYRDKVKKIVDTLIMELPLTLPITGESDMWVILMGIEHERIHIETSLVLHRQMPLEFIKEVDDFNLHPQSLDAPQNEMIDIAKSTIYLGKERTHNLYGWDNEYGSYTEEIESFQTAKYLVSNAEYMKFVRDGGYETSEYWDEEGLNFLKTSGAKHPTFWVEFDGEYRYRALSSVIDMPQNFPVDVNALEAEAFCRYKTQKEGVRYSLPSESQYRAIYERSGLEDILELSDSDANQNFVSFSSSPVNRYNFNGIYDVVGNVWQWSRTSIFGFDGFEVHKAYDDFSVPTFDNKHSLILGSSWASSGNLIMKNSRYAFRKHFYQNAGFRYVISTDNSTKKEQNSYEEDVTKNCIESYFSEVDYSYIAKAIKYVTTPTTKALDFGCKTGRSSFELARYFSEVDGVDISARYIRVGVDFKEYTILNCLDKTISLNDFGYERVKDQVAFKQADPNNLKENFGGYNFVVANVENLELFIDNIKDRVTKNAILVVFSPIDRKEFELLEESKGFYILRKRG
ncbi:MAG: 5-histidylcysteine sulfoxide synthase [Campylobacterota bacterium]|nr:5-histidylcysteine sulfoxide synthase [Campylobacterota bacterium]